MIKTTSAFVVDFYEIISKFDEISGWENLLCGPWNGSFKAPVSYEIEHSEAYTFQREQDIVVFSLRPNDLRLNFKDAPADGIITLDFIKYHSKLTLYKGNFIHIIPFGFIVHYLREANELPWHQTLIITNDGTYQ